MNRLIAILFAVSVVLLAACAQKPTKAYTTADIDTLFMQKKLRRPIRVNSNTVLVDARSDFEFSMLHAPQSVHLQWSDFTKDSNSGALKDDLSEPVKRLALLGISPKSNVIVLSGDKNGWADAGRVAWTLQYLGFSEVQLVDQNALGLRFYNTMAPPRSNVPSWQPQFNERLIVKPHEVARLLSAPLPSHTHVLYVGTEQTNRAPMLHFDWSRFFNKNGRPNVKMVKTLRVKGVELTDSVVVVSKRGIRSGAVAFALSAMGFRNVANCAAGMP